MKPEIDGVVAKIHFVEGQPVTSGEVLVTLRDDLQRAHVEEMRAELRLAEQVYVREKKLAKRNASSPAAIEETSAKRDTAAARLHLARIALEQTRIRAPFDGIPLVAPGAAPRAGFGARSGDARRVSDALPADSDDRAGDVEFFVTSPMSITMPICFIVPATYISLARFRGTASGRATASQPGPAAPEASPVAGGS